MSTRLNKCVWAIGGVALLVAHGAVASVNVGAGSSINFADATVDFGCADLTVAGQGVATVATLIRIANLGITGGTLAPGASSVSLGGDFADAGTFTAGTSRVQVVDACGSGVSRVSGATNFYDLIVDSSAGKQLVLPANTIQSVAHALTLQGTVGNLLQIVSSVSGQRAQLALANGAMQVIAYVNARDNAATQATIAPGPASSYQSVDAGNLINWFANATGTNTPAVPAPALSPTWLTLLGLLLSSVSLTLLPRHRRARRRNL